MSLRPQTGRPLMAHYAIERRLTVPPGSGSKRRSPGAPTRCGALDPYRPSLEPAPLEDLTAALQRNRHAGGPASPGKSQTRGAANARRGPDGAGGVIQCPLGGALCCVQEQQRGRLWWSRRRQRRRVRALQRRCLNRVPYFISARLPEKF